MRARRITLGWVLMVAVTGPSWADGPSAAGHAAPASLLAGDAVTLTAVVTAGTNPSSTGLDVTCDLTSIGGGVSQILFDDGTNGDLVAADLTFTFATTLASSTSAGNHSLIGAVSDAQTRSAPFTIAITVLAVCGDGRIEGPESCDDGDTEFGDGCSGFCEIEPGYECTVELARDPDSVCTVLAGTFWTLPPCRVVDTRFGDGGILATGIPRTFPLEGICQVVAAAEAVVLNVTVVGASESGNLAIYPANLSSPTETIVVAFAPVAARAGLVVVGLSPEGAVTVFPTGGPVHLILDINGYFY